MLGKHIKSPCLVWRVWGRGSLGTNTKEEHALGQRTRRPCLVGMGGKVNTKEGHAFRCG